MSNEDPESFLQNVALLVVDMQPPLLQAIPGSDTLVKRVGFALEAAVLFRMKIFFTEQSPSKLGNTHPELLQAASGADAPEFAVFAKDSFSALHSEELSQRLLPHGIDHLLLAGVETSICVYQTVITALDREMEITVLSDCIGARRAEDAAHALNTLRDAGCYLLSSETVFYSLMKTATHPAFRQFNRLVKAYS